MCEVEVRHIGLFDRGERPCYRASYPAIGGWSNGRRDPRDAKEIGQHQGTGDIRRRRGNLPIAGSTHGRAMGSIVEPGPKPLQ